MTERPRDDEQSPSDWLASRFGATDPPVPPSVPPAAPAASVPPVPPATPAAPVPPATPAASVPPAAPAPPPLIEPGDTLAPPPVESSASPWDEPTQLMDALPADGAPAPDAPPTSTAPAAPDPYAGLAAAELLGVASAAPDPGTTSALETLFGDDNFRDYEAEPAATVPFTRAAAKAAAPAPAAAPPGPGTPVTVTRTQKILLAVAGGFVALLALAALFLLGTRLPDIFAADEPAPIVTPEPEPEPTVPPVGPVEPGTWAWDELRGGECLDPFTDPWAEEFTVVDCADPHPAQLVTRGEFPPPEAGADVYPGAEALQGQLALLCAAPGVIDLAVAGQYPDVQFQGTYPATAEQWEDGDRFYYCFVSRSSGEPLTGSLAVPPPTPAEDTAPEPAA